MQVKQLTLSFLILASSISTVAQDAELPAVQVDGEFYGYAEAARTKGAQVFANSDGSYTISNAGKKFLIKANGKGLNAASAALFPTSVLVNFEFKKTIKSGKTLVNDRGPIKTIKIDSKGNGSGSAYIDPKDGDQSIEVTNDTTSAKGHFPLKKNRKVECEGEKELTCSSS